MSRDSPVASRNGQLFESPWSQIISTCQRFDSHRDSITGRCGWHSVWADRPPPTIAPNEQVVFGCQSDGVFSSAEAHAQVSHNGVLLRRHARQLPATAPQ
eukprot:COSAG01_NODE_7067_length_3368_cov_12.018748_7_plen_100_part_00